MLINEKFPNVECLMGVATGGITHAAYVSEILNLPMGYVRKSNKEHGKGNAVEGKIIKGQKIVVIEDLFSTGNSSLKSVNILKENEYDILGVVSIFSYQLKKFKENFKNIKNYSLTNLNVLLKVAHKQNIIKKNEITLVNNFINEL
jgi:orotate phosphoribosyltransferase